MSKKKKAARKNPRKPKPAYMHQPGLVWIRDSLTNRLIYAPPSRSKSS